MAVVVMNCIIVVACWLVASQPGWEEANRI